MERRHPNRPLIRLQLHAPFLREDGPGATDRRVKETENRPGQSDPLYQGQLATQFSKTNSRPLPSVTSALN